MGILDGLKNTNIDFQNPSAYADPFNCKTQLPKRDDWQVSRSTRRTWRDWRNVTVGPVRRVDGQLELHYQYHDWNGGQPRLAIIKPEQWGVLGVGRIGTLADWMRETPYGIEDSAGEVRGDWRKSWAVVIVNDEAGEYEGVDVLGTPYHEREVMGKAASTACGHHPTVPFRGSDLFKVSWSEMETAAEPSGGEAKGDEGMTDEQPKRSRSLRIAAKSSDREAKRDDGLTDEE